MRPSVARRVSVVAPRENRYLVFDGALFHGVVPGRTQEEAERVTLLVNWWDQRLSDADRHESSNAELGLRDDMTPLAGGRRVRDGAVVCSRAVVLGGCQTTLLNEAWQHSWT